ncbi:MAG: hypothetical protein BWY87_00240 [Deltaproteobacteria bacterium ADurb.Bin510]|nr:MAG: hypothetical protein BWY87_00240 [Deltaproteobacteria bacterium ADurb.Bin510]
MRILLDGRAAPVLAPEPVVLLWLFGDEELLSGLNAAVDRQTGGLLKRLLADSNWRGEPGAKLLCGCGALSLLLIGLGGRNEFAPSGFAACLNQALDAMRDLGLKDLALTLPHSGQATGLAAVLVEVLASRDPDLEVRLLCAPGELEATLYGLQQAKVRLKRSCGVTIAVRV